MARQSTYSSASKWFVVAVARDRTVISAFSMFCENLFVELVDVLTLVTWRGTRP